MRVIQRRPVISLDVPSVVQPSLEYQHERATPELAMASEYKGWAPFSGEVQDVRDFRGFYVSPQMFVEVDGAVVPDDPSGRARDVTSYKRWNSLQQQVGFHHQSIPKGLQRGYPIVDGWKKRSTVRMVRSTYPFRLWDLWTLIDGANEYRLVDPQEWLAFAIQHWGEVERFGSVRCPDVGAVDEYDLFPELECVELSAQRGQRYLKTVPGGLQDVWPAGQVVLLAEYALSYDV